MQYSKSNELSKFNPYEPLQKGYAYEMEIQHALDNLKVSFRGNPKNFEEWVSNKGAGADIFLPFAEIECKFRTKYFNYPSWILRDWISRFSFREGIERIVVTNFKWFVGSTCRKLLYDRQIKLMDTCEFIWWLTKKLGSHSKDFLSYIVNPLGILLVYHRNGYILTKLEDYFDG